MDPRSDQVKRTRRTRAAAPKAVEPSQATVPGVHPANTLNELTGAQWLYFTRSALTTAYPHNHGHQRRKAHGANKPPDLMAELIRFFTKPGALVLDPFAGVGGTLLGAAICGRRAVGIELNPQWKTVYAQVCAEQKIEEFPVAAGDCRKVLAGWETSAPPGCGQVDFVCTDPPYNRNFRRTMCEPDAHSYRRTDYVSFSEHADDLSNAAGYDAFLQAMGDVFALLLPVLRPGGYFALMVRNAYENGRYRLVHADMAAAAERHGWVLKGERVWYQAGTRLRPYGYPRHYIPNISHQHILIFQKPVGPRPA